MPINNRRKFPRLTLDGELLPPARIALYKPYYHEPFDVIIKDLSSGGMKFLSPEVLPRKFDFGLEFQLAGAINIQASAKVAHQIRAIEGYHVGAIFTKLEPSLRATVDGIIKDYFECEDRIRHGSGNDMSIGSTLAKIAQTYAKTGEIYQQEHADVCKRECHFLPLCRKPQKKY